MAADDQCNDRIAALEKVGMGFSADTPALCDGINALSDEQFQELLCIAKTMNSPAGQPYLGYGFGFQNRAGGE